MYHQPKEWQVYCKSLLHGCTSLYEMYIECIFVFVVWVPEFQKMNSGHVGKRKIRHAAIEARFWDHICPKNWVVNILQKKPIKTVITCNNICLLQITVYLENSRLCNQIWPKDRTIKILRNRHWIHNQDNAFNSCMS